jgi:hypothetical protein
MMTCERWASILSKIPLLGGGCCGKLKPLYRILVVSQVLIRSSQELSFVAKYHQKNSLSCPFSWRGI